MTKDKAPVPPPALVAEAKTVPGGWVYEIHPGVDPSGEVPPESIIGAWAVDDAGELTGEYIPNPRYVGAAPRSTTDPDILEVAEDDG
jgi:hypothetical protein